MELQEAVLELWNDNSIRGRFKEFKPVFIRYIGGLPETEYNDVCASLLEQAKKHPQKTIVISGPCEFKPRLDVLKQIKQELPQMDLEHISPKELTLFQDEKVNEIYLKSLGYVYKLAMRNKILSTRQQQENFICNMIVFSVHYLLSLHFDTLQTCKVIQYGELDERSIYFFILCFVMGMDVLALNPLRESEYWKEDLDSLCTRESLKRILPVLSLEQRAAKGTPIKKQKTAASVASHQVEDLLFDSTGSFRPWSFRQGALSSLLLSGTSIDIENSWNQQARFREGFEADLKNRKITVPHFFFEVQGLEPAGQDRDAWISFLQECRQNPACLLDSSQGKTLLKEPMTPADKYKLAFAMTPSGLFDPKRLQEMEGYPYKNISRDTENLLIETLNGTIQNGSRIFGHELSRQERLDLAEVFMTLSSDLVKKIDNFDFPFQIPKAVLFLEKEQGLPVRVSLLMAYLSYLGMDIALFSPAGMSGLDRMLAPGQFTRFRSGQMSYASTLKDFMGESDFFGPGNSRTEGEEKKQESWLDSVFSRFMS